MSKSKIEKDESSIKASTSRVSRKSEKVEIPEALMASLDDNLSISLASFAEIFES